MDADIRAAIDGLGTAFDEYKKTNDQRIAEIKKTGEASDATLTKLIALEKGMEGFEDLKERLEKAEMSLKRRVSAGNEIDAMPEDERHQLKCFDAFIRDPKDQKAAREYQEATLALKQVELTTPQLGGFAVPGVLSRSIEKKLLEVSDMRSLVTVQQASTTDFSMLVDLGGAASGWVGEKQKRTETDTPGLAPIKPTFGTLYAYPKATEESLNDMFFNVVNWLSDSVADSFAYQEGRAILTGNGVNKPTGMLHNEPVAIGDHEGRALQVYEYLRTNNADGFGSTPDRTDPIIDLIYTLQNQYRRNAKFLMNRMSMATIRKFKDSEGNYIWVPGLTAGASSMLMGYGVQEVEGIAGIEADSFPIAFGDFKKAYLLADLVGLRVTPDEITTPGFVKWYFRKRMGGCVLNNDAVKWLRVEEDPDADPDPTP